MQPRLRAHVSETLSSFRADIDGDGILGNVDAEVMRRALFTSRGFSIEPNPNFDFRADVFGRGQVDQEALDAVSRTIGLLGNDPTLSDPRPIVVAWHYGWYDRVQRPLLLQTVRYLGGDYLSNDPRVETEFNQLKNEFGITVDALSWMPSRVSRTILPNYEMGYFAASNAATRHVALLYEASLSLPAVGGRTDFRSAEVSDLLVADFEAMARTMVAARDRYATRVWLLDGRPVVFIFASHSWGLHANDTLELERITIAVHKAREGFRRVYGAYPYIVGDELLSVASSSALPAFRLSRARNYDAVFSYHAANLKPTATPFAIDQAYGGLQRARLERASQALSGVVSRFDGRRLLIIPSLAGGFAKHGLPIITAGRHAYADYIKLLVHFHSERYLPQEFPGVVGTPRLPGGIYSIGSWNEEFEGHAVFPAQFNLAFGETEQHGFDWAMAVKQVFGWNHYAQRPILGS